MARRAVSTRTRFEVFKRDHFTCQYCGRTPPAVVLHVDHVIAVSEGGSNDQTNLVTACEGCNMGKSNVPLDAIPASLEEQAEAARERAAQVEAYAALLQEERDRQEEWCWEVAEVLKPGASNGYSTHQFRSISMFVRRLGYPQTLEAAHIATDRFYEGTKRFKYFCGVCWKKIKDAEAMNG